MTRRYIITAFAVLIIALPLITNNSLAQPVVLDTILKIEHVFSAPFKPSNMAFLGHNDILLLDRDEGKVFRVVNGKMIPKPALDVNVATIGYRGMLGIDILKTKDKHVYVSYTILSQSKRTRMTKLIKEA